MNVTIKNKKNLHTMLLLLTNTLLQCVVDDNQ